MYQNRWSRILERSREYSKYTHHTRQFFSSRSQSVVSVFFVKCTSSHRIRKTLLYVLPQFCRRYEWMKWTKPIQRNNFEKALFWKYSLEFGFIRFVRKSEIFDQDCGPFNLHDPRINYQSTVVISFLPT